VGDSFTWGQGIKGNKHRFTEQLEEKLTKSAPAGKKTAVLNFGRGGADTRQEIQIIKESVAKIHPDIVIVCYLSNDIDSSSFARHWENYGNTGEKLSSITPTVNYFYWRFIGPLKYHQIGTKYMESLVEAYNNPETFQKHQDELRTLIKEIRAIGAQPVFVILPFPQMWKLFPKDIRDNIYNRIAASVRQEQVPVIDLSYMEEKFPLEQFQVNSADAHPNEKIHAEFAGAIYNWLINNGDYKTLLKNP
jgi:lysophospholipase L1-like esterase